jgi:phospholipid/cholesterol/gamma-HCH transport system ATP-binding protein
MAMETNNPIALELRDLSLSFDERQVLSHVNLKLQRGEMIFITGVSGSGKSVLLRLAMRLEQPDSGQVFVEGVDCGKLDESELLTIRGERMGMVFQEDSLFTGMTVYDNAAYRLVEHGVAEEAVEQAVREVLEFVGLQNEADKFPAELSGGMRRRLEIARALIGWPSIMLFDEPASGLDPITAVQVLDLIIRARDIYGISSLYVTKKLDEISYLAAHRAKVSAGAVVIEAATERTTPPTRVFVLDAGQVVFNGSVPEFESSSLPVVTHLTQAENGTTVSGFTTSDPWDKRRQPLERIL